jgi:hypothetical protein
VDAYGNTLSRVVGFQDMTALPCCDILALDLIGLIGYSYQQDIPSFLEAHLKELQVKRAWPRAI